MSPPRWETLFSEEQIRERVQGLAREIVSDHPGLELDLVGVLKGSAIFLADLLRCLPETTRIHFIHARSYEGRESQGSLQLQHRLQLTDRHVVLVEDILDTGLTADPAMTYDGLTGAMRDHILAAGEVVGLGQADPTAPPPASR